MDWRATSDEEYYYRVKKVAGLVGVFNVTRQYVGYEGDDYLDRRDAHYDGHFGGSMLLCTNEEFFCIRGGVYAVVPKDLIGQTNWTFYDMACQSDGGLREGVVSLVSCTFKEKVSRFRYERAQGIVSFEHTATGWEFELLGSRGLFANPDATKK